MLVDGEIVEVPQVDISIDAVASTRSYKHHYKARQLIFLVVSSDTGKPIGYELMSNFCDKCFRAMDKGEPRPVHDNCTWNHYHGIGTAEAGGARKWAEKQGSQNVPHVARQVGSDGDSRASNIIIQKAASLLEQAGSIPEAYWVPCVNHSTKCMTSSLLGVKKDFHLDGILTVARIKAIGCDIMAEVKRAGAQLPQGQKLEGAALDAVLDQVYNVINHHRGIHACCNSAWCKWAKRKEEGKNDEQCCAEYTPRLGCILNIEADAAAALERAVKRAITEKTAPLLAQNKTTNANEN